MTREEFMRYAAVEIENTLGPKKNRLLNLVNQAWAEGKKSAEVDELTGVLLEALCAANAKKAEKTAADQAGDAWRGSIDAPPPGGLNPADSYDDWK